MIKKIVAGAVCAAAVCVFVAPSADARSLAANAASAVTLDAACFSSYPMSNICSTTQSLWWDLTSDSAGAKTITVVVKAASTGANVQCAAFAVAANGTGVNYSNVASATVFGTTSTLTLTGANVPAMGTLSVNCSVGPGSAVYTVNYNQ
jgi:hypothetical protein